MATSAANVTSTRNLAFALPVYVALVLACCLGCLLVLRQKESTDQSALARATLIVSPQDVDTLTFVRALAGFPHVEVIRADAPGAGKRIIALAGGAEVATPMLVVPYASGPARYSGTGTVEKIMEPLVSMASRYTLGEKAIIVMGCFAVFCAFFAAELGRVPSLLSAVAVVAFMGLTGSCLLCTSSPSATSAFSSVAPILGLCHVFVANFFFGKGWYLNRAAASAFTAFTAAVPFVQLGALVADPKLCPSCLAYGFVTLAYAAAMINRATGTHRLGAIKLPAAATTTIAVMLGLLIARNALFLTGRLDIPETMSKSPTNFVGRALSDFATDRTEAAHGPRASRIVIVGQDGCPHCADAERALRSRGVGFDEYVAAPVPGPGKFVVSGSTSVPIVLVVDGDGKIIFQRDGWIIASGEELLVHQLREIQNGKENPIK